MTTQALVKQWPAMLSDEVQSVLLRVATIAVIAIVLSLTTSGFATTDNLLNVLRQASLLFLVASGLTLVIIGGGSTSRSVPT